MNSRILIGIGAAALLALSGCGGKKTIFGNPNTPDELAVTRNAPLVVPPDFNMRPPRPGAPRAQEVDAQSQAVEALFGEGAKVAPKTPGEQALLDSAKANLALNDIRSTLRDNGTTTANKGAFLKDLLAAEPGDRQPATATVSKGGSAPKSS